MGNKYNSGGPSSDLGQGSLAAPFIRHMFFGLIIVLIGTYLVSQFILIPFALIIDAGERFVLGITLIFAFVGVLTVFFSYKDKSDASNDLEDVLKDDDKVESMKLLDVVKEIKRNIREAQYELSQKNPDAVRELCIEIDDLIRDAPHDKQELYMKMNEDLKEAAEELLQKM